MPTSFGLRFPSVYDGLDDRHLPPTVRSVKVPTASIWLERLLCAHTGAPLAPLVPNFFFQQRRKQNVMKLFQALLGVGSAALPALVSAASPYDSLSVHVPFEFVAAGQSF